MNATNEKSVDEKIEELEKKQRAREAGREEKAKLHRLEKAELVDKYEEELGPLGVAFALVDCGLIHRGWLVVKNPEKAAYKRYQAIVEKGVMKERSIDDSEKHAYAMACVVHPAREVALQLFADHSGVSERVIAAANYLATGQREREEGKF